MHKEDMEESKKRYNALAAEEERIRSEGKSQLGVRRTSDKVME